MQRRVVLVFLAGFGLAITMAGLVLIGPRAASPESPFPADYTPNSARVLADPICGDAPAPSITDLAVRQVPPLAEPATRSPYRDPVFGSCVVRVTDRKADLAPGDRSGGMKNEYSRVQSFNADGNRLLVRGTEGTWYVYDAITLQPVAQVPVDMEPRWDAVNPGLIYYSDVGTKLMSYDLSSKSQRVVHDFAADFPGQELTAVWTRHEGSPSLDGRYWGFMAQNKDWETVALLVYDRQSDQIIAKRDLPKPTSIDSVTISPLGGYFLAYHDGYCATGKLGSDANPCGLMVYDRELKSGRSLLRIIGHSDLALDAAGREVLIYQDIDTDSISLLDLATGKVTVLSAIDFSHSPIGLHFSGRALHRPGWAIVSTYQGSRPTQFTWMDDQVFAMELKAGGRVARLAHSRSVYDPNQEQDYWAEPHASSNSDMTRVLFTSNWGRTGTNAVDAYMIGLPSDWPARLP